MKSVSYNEVTSEPTITRYTTIVRKTLKVFFVIGAGKWIQNAFCCGVAILQHGLPWRRRPETLSRVNYRQTLRIFLTIVVYRVIVGLLVISL
jgi:hypothetical protein